MRDSSFSRSQTKSRSLTNCLLLRANFEVTYEAIGKNFGKKNEFLKVLYLLVRYSDSHLNVHMKIRYIRVKNKVVKTCQDLNPFFKLRLNLFKSYKFSDKISGKDLEIENSYRNRTYYVNIISKSVFRADSRLKIVLSRTKD